MTTTTSHRKVWVAVLVLWVCFIWIHSLLSGETSDTESLWWVQMFDPFFSTVGIDDVSMRNHIVRKTAHFTEYLILGLLATAALRPRWGKGHTGVAPVVAIACAVPCIDEFLQLFVPGRTGSPADVLLDMCGAAVGLAIGALVLRSRPKKT